MKKHPEQNEQFEAQLRNLPDTVNQSLAGLTAGTELNNRIQMAVRDSRASRQKKSFPVRRGGSAVRGAVSPVVLPRECTADSIQPLGRQADRHRADAPR